jgi:hypothetical protein
MLAQAHKAILSLNDSKLFAGLVMILMNIGSKYITIKFSKSQETYLKNYVARELLIFAVCWMGTKDIYMSLLLTAAFFVLTQHLFNEDSPLCVLPSQFKELHNLMDLDNDGKLSDEEIEHAKKVLAKAATHFDTKRKTWFNESKI